MARPRPRIAGKPSPSIAESKGKSVAEPTARVIPSPLSKNSLAAKRKLEGSVRAKAAERMMEESKES